MPKCWTAKKLGSCLSLIRNGLTQKQNKDGLGLPISRIETIAQERINLDKVGYVDGLSKDKVEAYRLRARDILFSHINSEPQLGRTAIYTGKPDLLIHGMNLLLLRANSDLAPEFLHLVCTYFRQQGIFISLAGRAVGQSSINQGKLKALDIPCPPLNEQRRIATILSTVQRAIEQQERLIALTTELKKSLMHKLFTEGTRGESQKQTEIGPVPESWGVARLEDLTKSFTYGTSVKCDYDRGGLPVLRIPNVVGGQVDVSDLKYGDPKPNEHEALRLQVGDLLFVRTNGVQKNAGRCSMYRGELGDNCYFASYLIRVRLNQSVLISEFLNEYVRTSRGAPFLEGKANRTADGKYNINTGTLKDVLVAVPSIGEQREISETLAQVNRISETRLAFRNVLEQLFRTLLHQLMTAQIRVNDVDLSGLGLEIEDETPQGDRHGKKAGALS